MLYVQNKITSNKIGSYAMAHLYAPNKDKRRQGEREYRQNQSTGQTE